MLNNHRITIVANTVVDEVEIATYGAILNVHTGEMSLTNRHIDNELCKIHKDVVRADRAEFEDFAYKIQDSLATETETA
jgi:hypothetical protein